MPEDGYHGQDIIDIAGKLAKEHGDAILAKSDDERFAFFRQHGLALELDKLKQT